MLLGSFALDFMSIASTLKVDEHTLSVFYPNVHDSPESILLSTIDLQPHWMNWNESELTTIIEPQREYEGVCPPLKPSIRGWAPQMVRQLRDPAIFRDDGRRYLLYSVAGEYGITIAKILE